MDYWYISQGCLETDSTKNTSFIISLMVWSSATLVTGLSYTLLQLIFLRSVATGFMLTFAFIIGAISPYVPGVLKPTFGLSNGLAFLSVVYIFSAICILVAILFFYKRDLINQKLPQENS